MVVDIKRIADIRKQRVNQAYDARAVRAAKAAQAGKTKRKRADTLKQYRANQVRAQLQANERVRVQAKEEAKKREDAIKSVRSLLREIKVAEERVKTEEKQRKKKIADVRKRSLLIAREERARQVAERQRGRERRAAGLARGRQIRAHNVAKRRNQSSLPSSWVDYYAYNETTQILYMKIQNTSYIMYWEEVGFDFALRVLGGEATCVTDDSATPMRWWVGKNPSLGAAYHHIIKPTLGRSQHL